MIAILFQFLISFLNILMLTTTNSISVLTKNILSAKALLKIKQENHVVYKLGNRGQNKSNIEYQEIITP